jgi:hypothetical protein
MYVRLIGRDNGFECKSPFAKVKMCPVYICSRPVTGHTDAELETLASTKINAKSQFVCRNWCKRSRGRTGKGQQE